MSSPAQARDRNSFSRRARSRGGVSPLPSASRHISRPQATTLNAARSTAFEAAETARTVIGPLIDVLCAQGGWPAQLGGAAIALWFVVNRKKGLIVVGAHTRLGYVHYLAGRYDEALARIRKMRELEEKPAAKLVASR